MNKVKDKKFAYLCIWQFLIIAITFLKINTLNDYKALYQDVKEFTPTHATCIDSDYRSRSRHRSSSYTNTYQYIVDNQTYTVTYKGERSRGSSTTLYYNPNNPSLVSKYANYEEARANNVLWFVFALVGQGVIIFFAVKAVRQQKENSIENVGVVVSDDFNYVMDEPMKPYTDNRTFAPKENERGVESIPFQRSEKKQKVDEVETIAFTRSSSKPAEEFTLYTEDEYKQMQKDEK